MTNHGVLQANRLGAHLSATDVKITRIFSSDLQRAFKTAEAIRSAQSGPSVVQLPLLREQDFGYYEGKRFYERPKDSGKSGKEAHLEAHKNDPGFQDVESKESMRLRADTFVDQYLEESLKTEGTVVVVAHGIILNHLWRAILGRFHPGKVVVSPSVVGTDRGLEYLGGWSNTGYLELEVRVSAESRPTDRPSAPQITTTASPSVELTSAPSSTPSPPVSPSASLGTQSLRVFDMVLVVKAVNSQEHLKGLKKTRGGIGSLKHDSSQKTVDSFFKKRRLE